MGRHPSESHRKEALWLTVTVCQQRTIASLLSHKVIKMWDNVFCCRNTVLSENTLLEDSLKQLVKEHFWACWTQEEEGQPSETTIPFKLRAKLHVCNRSTTRSQTDGWGKASLWRTKFSEVVGGLGMHLYKCLKLGIQDSSDKKCSAISENLALWKCFKWSKKKNLTHSQNF